MKPFTGHFAKEGALDLSGSLAFDRARKLMLLHLQILALCSWILQFAQL